MLQSGGIGPDGTLWEAKDYPLFTPRDRYLLVLRPAQRPGFDADLFYTTGAYQGVFTVDADDRVNPILEFGFGSRVHDEQLLEVARAIRRRS